ncbi:hypothetical protein REPUB_Repub02eG0167700 [Reevesia pubescens]
MDFRKALMRGVMFGDGLTNCKSFAKLKYEWLSYFCYLCGCLGHVDKVCENLTDVHVPTSKPYKEWMKASPFPSRSNRRGKFRYSPRNLRKTRTNKGDSTNSSCKEGTYAKGLRNETSCSGLVVRKLNMDLLDKAKPMEEMVSMDVLAILVNQDILWTSLHETRGVEVQGNILDGAELVGNEETKGNNSDVPEIKV